MIKSIRIPIDKVTGKQKAIALVTFSNEKEAMKTILKSDIIELGGKKLKVQMADKYKTARILGIKYFNLFQRGNKKSRIWRH